MTMKTPEEIALEQVEAFTLIGLGGDIDERDVEEVPE